MARKNDGHRHRRCTAFLSSSRRGVEIIRRLFASNLPDVVRESLHPYSIIAFTVPGRRRHYASLLRSRHLSRPPRSSISSDHHRSASTIVYRRRRHCAIDTTTGGVVVDPVVALWDGPWYVCACALSCVCVLSDLRGGERGMGSRRRRRRRR